MKQLLPFFTVLLFSSGLFAQDWAPVRYGETYHYKIDSSDWISHSISGHNIQISGSDTIFTIDRIVIECDTCTPARYGGQDSLLHKGYVKYNQPQFTQNQIVSQGGGKYRFTDPGNRVIYTLAPQYFSWLFDSIQNVTATIDTVFLSTVLSIPDSVKQISLSNGDTILLSKRHGFIRHPDIHSSQYFTIMGIQEKALGDTLPGFFGFFNLQVGDVMMYEYYYAECAPCNGNTWPEKWEVLSRQEYPDSISFDFSLKKGAGFWWWSTYSGTGIPSSTNIHKTVPIGAGHLTEMLPGTFIQDRETHMYSFYNQWAWYLNGFGTGRFQDVVEYDLDTTGKIRLRYRYGGMKIDMGLSVYYPDQYLQIVDTVDQVAAIHINDVAISYRQAYLSGIGVDFSEVGEFEYGFSWKLTGYIQNGDTTGTITPDSILLSSGPSPAAMRQQIQIFPNPVSTMLHVQHPQAATGELRLFDLQGRETKRQHCTGAEWRFELADIPKGIYLLQVTAGDLVVHEKILVE